MLITQTKTNWRFLAIVIGLAIIVAIAVFSFKVSEFNGFISVNKYSCVQASDCQQKTGQCTVECLAKNQEPVFNNSINCEFRPWLEGERCECQNHQCVKITQEDINK